MCGERAADEVQVGGVRVENGGGDFAVCVCIARLKILCTGVDGGRFSIGLFVGGFSFDDA